MKMTLKYVWMMLTLICVGVIMVVPKLSIDAFSKISLVSYAVVLASLFAVFTLGEVLEPTKKSNRYF